MATPMATRSIVTSQPDVACDVCGRRLLRGERPDVFLAGGRRRTVCELCAPRATHEGWLREDDQLRHAVSLSPARPRRGRNLIDRLRALREGAPRPVEEILTAAPPAAEDPRPAAYDFFDAVPSVAEPVGPVPVSEPPSSGGDVKLERALEVFNAGEHPRRIAGVARSLGAPTVTVRELAESASTVVGIVVAWELCWYRYEVDLDDETAGAVAVAQGTELSELAAEDKLANAAADELGALSFSLHA